MKIVNALKLKVELDYESQCRGLQEQVDSLTKELERQQYLRKKEKKVIKEELKVCEVSLGELENSLTLGYEECQLKFSAYQKDFTETSQMYEKKLVDLERQLEDMRTCENSGDQRCLCENEKLLQQYQLECSTYQKVIVDTTQMYEKIIADLSKQLEHMHASYGAEYLTRKQQYVYDNEETNQEVDEIDVSLDMTVGIDNRLQEIEVLRLKLQDMAELHERAVVDIQSLEAEKGALTLEKGLLLEELGKTQQKLMEEERQKRCLEDEMNKLKKSLVWSSLNFDNTTETTSGFKTQMSLPKSRETKETKQRETIAKILEEVGVRNILVLLKSEDLDILVHAIKAVANLAAEDLNQEEIVREGGLDALLLLLQSSQDAIVQRVASGAIANLAMNGMNQEYIVQKGGAQLLADAAFRTDDPQTMRIVAGAVANLCGNEKVHLKLKEDGGTKALLAMARSGRSDVIAQVARGLANFAKCESRGITRGWTKGKSLLIDDGALGWLISNSATASGSTRRHIDLALCHLAQNGS